MVLVWGVVCSFGGGVSWCPLVQRCAGVRGFRTCRRLALVLWWCAPSFSPLYCIALCRVACKYGSISRFKGVFRGFYGADVCLCGFGVFRGLCGFCARVELGGYMACGVFASILPSFALFCPLLSSFLSSILSLCSCVCLSFYLFAPAFFVCPLVLCLSSLSLWVVVVSFSLTDVCAKREGAIPCVLSCPVVGCFIWLLLYIPRTRQVSTRLYRNKVLEKGNLTECSKLFCARLCSCLCSSKFVLFLFSYLLPLVGSYFLSPFRLLCCIWNYKTICSRFNPERVPCYPRNREEIATMSDYSITVSAFALHHHTAGIVCACLFGAWLSVCLIQAVNVAAIVGVNITLCLFGCVLN